MLKKEKQVQVFLLEITLLFFLFFFSLNIYSVVAGVGENVTVISNLTIGESGPIIKNINIENGFVVLTAATTTTVNCEVILEDYEGDDTIKNISAQFFDVIDSDYDLIDDNNNHYTNDSCYINTSYGDSYEAKASCLFEVEYYANPGNWNCSVLTYDQTDFGTSGTNSTVVQDLLALGLPDTINYGEINVTSVSLENITNVTNYGNVDFNLSLSGYARTEEDGLAMNCSLGSVGTIDLSYEKYNLTSTTVGDLSLNEFEDTYTNLTDTPVVREFNLAQRTDDLVNDAKKSTYWRIYVPRGVAGTCEGNIIFGAVEAVGS